jgi:hypothetical protein
MQCIHKRAQRAYSRRTDEGDQSGQPYRLIWAAAALVLLFWAVSPALAGVTATISGTVKDPSGAVVVGATVEVKSIATGLEETRVTNADGFYIFADLAPGKYDLAVRQTGFSSYRQTGLVLDVDSSQVVNVNLAVGGASQMVEVISSSVTIETASTQNGEVISGQTITGVPLVTRSYTDLLALQPGVVPTSSGLAGSLPGQFTSAGFAFPLVSGDLNAGNLSVDGQREASNGFLLNGITVQESAFSGAAAIPELDSISEFRILTNNFDAEYGNYSGGQINVVTKSGTNHFHGDAFEFLRNTDFDAKNFFSTSRDDYKQNQFGGTIGGPIRKEKIFFFADYQGNRVIQGQSALGRFPVPSNAERAGDFSADTNKLTGTVQGAAWAQALSSTLGYNVTQGEAYYTPTCATTTQCVFPGAQIPTHAFSVPSGNLLTYIPPVTFVDPATGISYYQPNALPQRLNDDKTSGRVDLNSRYGMLAFYYFFDQFSQKVPNALLPGFGSDFKGRTQVANFGDTKTFGSGTLNEFRFGFIRLNDVLHSPTGGQGVTPASLGFEEGPDTLGISPSVPQYAHIPNINFDNFGFQIGAAGAPLGVTENTWQFVDNFSKVIRTHTITVGGSFRYNQLVEKNLGSNGNFDFNGSETGFDFADFLIGAPSGYSQGQGYPSYGRSRYIGLFGQDSWRIRPNVTLNYGLRWDVSRPWSELHGELETLVPGLQSVLFPGSPTGWVFPGDPGIPSTLAPTRWNNFAPRIGMAYSPNAQDGFWRAVTGGPGMTSIKAGWGKFYTTFEGATNFNEIGDAPFGNFYNSPVPPQFVTPFVDRGTGFIEGQRFPVPPPPFNTSPSNPDNSVNWALFTPIGGSPGFWYKNVLPYAEQYQLTIERQLLPSTLFQISYVGSQGHHLLSSIQANPGNPALCVSVSQLSQVVPGTPVCGPGGENGTYSPVGGGTINGTRGPFGQLFTSDGYFKTIGKSSYNSLQLSLKHSSSRATFLVGYTFSKAQDNASGYGEQINVQNPGERALSAFDARHNFVFSYNYRLPIDLLGGPRRLTHGWQLSGITRFATGLPVTLWENDDNSLLGTSSPGAIGSPIDRPNYNGGHIHFSDPRSGQPYFTSSVFSQEQIGQLGTSSRRFFSGPGLNNWDIALLKDTTITESTALQFRAELFNAFNHAQFGLPNGNIGAGLSFGIVTTANPPRIMQLSMKFLF